MALKFFLVMGALLGTATGLPGMSPQAAASKEAKEKNKPHSEKPKHVNPVP